MCGAVKRDFYRFFSFSDKKNSKYRVHLKTIEKKRKDNISVFNATKVYYHSRIKLSGYTH